MRCLSDLVVAAMDLQEAKEQESRAWQSYSSLTGQRERWRVNAEEVNAPDLLEAWGKLARARDVFRDALDRFREENVA